MLLSLLISTYYNQVSFYKTASFIQKYNFSPHRKMCEIIYFNVKHVAPGGSVTD